MDGDERYTAVAGDEVICDPSAGSFTVTIPTTATAGTGARIVVKVGIAPAGNTVTYALSGSDHFNVSTGATSGTLSILGHAVVMQADAANNLWVVQSADVPLSQLDLRYDPLLKTVNAQTGTSYTLVATDAGKIVTLANAAAVALNIDTFANQPIAIGTEITVTGQGAGLVTITQMTGVTINPPPGSSLLLARYQLVRLVCVALNTWQVLPGQRPPDGTALVVNTAGQLAFAPTGPVSMGTQRLTGVAPATALTDAPNFGQTPHQLWRMSNQTNSIVTAATYQSLLASAPSALAQLAVGDTIVVSGSGSFNNTASGAARVFLARFEIAGDTSIVLTSPSVTNVATIYYNFTLEFTPQSSSLVQVKLQWFGSTTAAAGNGTPAAITTGATYFADGFISVNLTAAGTWSFDIKGQAPSNTSISMPIQQMSLGRNPA